MENPLALLEKRLETQTAVAIAAEIGVSPAYLSMVRRDKKPIGPKVLAYLGIEKQVTYKRNGNGAAKRGRNGR